MGLRSVLSIHLFTDHRVLGALNLYYEAHDDFSDDEIEVAKVVAAHASVALAKVRSERDLWRAIDSRHLIGQAQGMLMERFKLSPEKSFAVLRRYSQQHNIKLHEVAGALISTGRLPAEIIRAGRIPTARWNRRSPADCPPTGRVALLNVLLDGLPGSAASAQSGRHISMEQRSLSAIVRNQRDTCIWLTPSSEPIRDCDQPLLNRMRTTSRSRSVSVASSRCTVTRSSTRRSSGSSSPQPSAIASPRPWPSSSERGRQQAAAALASPMSCGVTPVTAASSASVGPVPSRCRWVCSASVIAARSS